MSGICASAWMAGVAKPVVGAEFDQLRHGRLGVQGAQSIESTGGEYPWTGLSSPGIKLRDGCVSTDLGQAPQWPLVRKAGLVLARSLPSNGAVCDILFLPKN